MSCKGSISKICQLIQLVIIQESQCNFYVALHHDPKPLTVGPGCGNKGQHLRQPDGTGDNP
jgi:hypothetical protein